MPSNELVTFREFHDQELMREFSRLLQEHAIPFHVDDTKPRFDVTFSNDESRRFYKIKVQPEGLDKARALAKEIDLETMKGLPSDYYLFGFSNAELKDVLVKSDEWSAFDVMLAENLLKERGAGPEEKEIHALKNDRVDLLDQPEEEDTLIIVCGYILSVIGIIFAFIIPLVLLNSRKTTQAGHLVPKYSAATRKHASFMLLIFILQLILLFVFFAPRYF